MLNKRHKMTNRHPFHTKPAIFQIKHEAKINFIIYNRMFTFAALKERCSSG
jgi:hypothetical protein